MFMKRTILRLTSILVVAAMVGVACTPDDELKENENNSGDNKNPQEAIPEAVDLGLSVNWATFNVGATKPEEFGDYYAWGETEPKTDYSWSSYKFRISGDNWDMIFSKYNTNNSYGTVDNKAVLDPEDDVAHVKWGGSWRMPTGVEFEELKENCTWVWTKIGGVEGYRVTSNVPGYTDRSIFLPAAGWKRSEERGGYEENGSHGYYWSGSLFQYFPFLAGAIQFDSSFVSYCADESHDISRCYGQSVRPVRPSDEWLSHITLSFDNDNVLYIPGISENLTVNVKYDGNDYSYSCDNKNSYSSSGIVWSTDNPAVATVNENGKITTLAKGTAHITAAIGTVSAQCTITVKEESEIEHNYVDLGLSVKWATVNVGATSPWSNGVYYAWGDVETKMNYYNGYYIYDYGYYQPELAPFGRDGYTMKNKYYYDEDGGYTVLDPEDDVAHVKWGGSWRMPTREEMNELKENCTWIWTTENGVDGFRVTSKKSGSSDASIFLPAARGISDRVRGKGNYWSASLSRDYNEAIYMYFNDDCRIDSVACFAGLSIRPVCP